MLEMGQDELFFRFFVILLFWFVNVSFRTKWEICWYNELTDDSPRSKNHNKHAPTLFIDDLGLFLNSNFPIQI